MALRTTRKDRMLNNIYYKVDEPEAYAGTQPLGKKVKGRIAKDGVQEWLQSQDTYTLFKPSRKRFRRNRYVVTNINDLWQADLVDMQNLKEYAKFERIQR